jgi:hypothetical protein
MTWWLWEGVPLLLRKFCSMEHNLREGVKGRRGEGGIEGWRDGGMVGRGDGGMERGVSVGFWVCLTTECTEVAQRYIQRSQSNQE